MRSATASSASAATRREQARPRRGTRRVRLLLMAELGIGDEIELTIGDVAHGGVFVARHDGLAIFVTDTAPGERVLARVTDVKRRFARADTLRVLDASPERHDHIWPEAGIDRDPTERVGGAEFGHLRLPAQRDLKQRVLTDALSRFAHLDLSPSIEALPGDDDLSGTRWRTRTTLHVDRYGTVGPYAARSHRIIPVASLPLAVPDLEELAPLHGRKPGTSGRIDLVQPSDLDARALFHPADRRGKRKQPAVIEERVGERTFRLDETGFWQVHRLAASTLFDAVKDAVNRDAFDPSARNLDLYGGVGLLAAAIGEIGGPDTRIETVEAVEPATTHAHANLAEWPNSSAVTARVDHFLRAIVEGEGSGALDGATVVLDPPRSGAGEDVVTMLDALRPAQIVYVACDPVALARDAGTLRNLGWTLDQVRGFDLFPNTHHLESVARFTRE